MGQGKVTKANPIYQGLKDKGKFRERWSWAGP